MTGKPGAARPRRAPRRPTGIPGGYWVVVCTACRHPGGLHIIEQREPRITRCRCCPGCTGYIDGDYAPWSDAMTREMAK